MRKMKKPQKRSNPDLPASADLSSPLIDFSERERETERERHREAVLQWLSELQLLRYAPAVVALCASLDEVARLDEREIKGLSLNPPEELRFMKAAEALRGSEPKPKAGTGAPAREPKREPKRERRNSLDNGRTGRARRNSMVALQEAAASYGVDESFLNEKLGEVLLHGFLEKRSGGHGTSDAHAATLAALDTELPIQGKPKKRERRSSFSKLVQRGRRPSIGDITRKWDTRFFVLTDKCLLYFKEPKEYLIFAHGRGDVAPAGAVPLAGAKITATKNSAKVAAGASGAKADGGLEFGLAAFFDDGPRTLVLKAESDEDRLDWIEELELAILELESSNDAAFYRKMPKVEVHAELLGCIRRSTLLELARGMRIDTSPEARHECPSGIAPLLDRNVDGNGVLQRPVRSESEPEPEPEPSISAQPGAPPIRQRRNTNRRMTADFKSLESDVNQLALLSTTEESANNVAPDERHKYFVILDVAWQVLSTSAAITRCTKEAVFDLAADNVIYTELRVSPRHVGDLTKTDYLEAVVRGIHEADSMMDVRLILSIARAMPPEEAMEVVELACMFNTRNDENLVVGVDLSGDPRFDKLEVWDRLRPVFDTARQRGLKVSLNFAEVRNTGEMMQMIDFDPDRLAHATTMMADKLFWTNFAEPIQQFPVPIEVLATVDLMTNGVNEIEDHHFAGLLQLRAPGPPGGGGSTTSYPLLISSSHPAVFPDARLSGEIGMLAAKFSVPRSRIAEMQRNSINHTFCDDDVKQRIREVFDDMLQKMSNEQAIAKTKPRRGVVARARRSSVVMMNAAAAAAAAAAGAAGDMSGKALTASAKGISTSMNVVMNPMLLPGQVGDMVGAAREKSATMLRMKQGVTKLYGSSEKSIRDVFNEFDTEGGGALGREDIRKAMLAMGMDADADIESTMAELSADSDGKVSFEAFDSYIEDALDASDVLEATDNVVESIEDIAADMARGHIHDISEALSKTLEVAQLETKAAAALARAGATDRRALALQRKFGSVDAYAHLESLKSVAHRSDPSGAAQALLSKANGFGHEAQIASVLKGKVSEHADALQMRAQGDQTRTPMSETEQAEEMLIEKGHDKVEALLAQAQDKTHALSEKADALRAKADEMLGSKGQEVLGDKRVQHLLAAAQKMMHCKTMEDRLELMKETAAELLEDYEDDSRLQALMRAVGQGRKLLEDGELTEEQMQTLLDCGLSDEQVEALAGTGRTAHSTHKLTSEDVKVLMQVGLTERQKKKLMATGMKAGMALGMRLFGKHEKSTGLLVGIAKGEISGQAAKQLAASEPHSESHFVQTLKHTVAEKLTQAVREAEIPPISGDLDKKGGKYELSNINVRHFEVPPLQTEFHMDENLDSVTLTVGGIGLRTDPFNFMFQKNTFPKVHDNGKAVLTLQDVGLEVILSVKEDPTTQVPQVDEVDVRMHVEDFRIDTIEGAHIKLYNKVFELVRFVVRKVVVNAINHILHKKIMQERQKVNDFLKGTGITKQAVLEQRGDLEVHLLEAQEEALRQLEETRAVVHTQTDAITHEAREALEQTAEASLVAAVQAAATSGTSLDADAEANLLKRVSGGRVEKHQAYSASVTDAFHAAALEQAEQPTQDESAREECRARARAFWSPQQFGRDANGNPVAGKEAVFNASREARKAVVSSKGVDVDITPAPAPEQRQKSPAARRDVKANREKARTAAQTAALQMPAMSSIHLSQLSTAVIHMNMQAQAAATVDGAAHHQAAHDQSTDEGVPSASNTKPGGMIGYLASYPIRNAQTKRDKEAKRQAKVQKAKSKVQGQQNPMLSQLGATPRGSGARRQENPMLSAPLSGGCPTCGMLAGFQCSCRLHDREFIPGNDASSDDDMGID